jgi:hypothetical protein
MKRDIGLLCVLLLASPVLAYNYSDNVRAASKSDTCLLFDEDHDVGISGDIVQSATTVEGEGVPPHKYMAIILDKPLCFTKDTTDKLSVVEVYPVPAKWLGHHVLITGRLFAGDAWSVRVRKIIDQL